MAFKYYCKQASSLNNHIQLRACKLMKQNIFEFLNFFKLQTANGNFYHYPLQSHLMYEKNARWYVISIHAYKKLNQISKSHVSGAKWQIIKSVRINNANETNHKKPRVCFTRNNDYLKAFLHCSFYFQSGFKTFDV